jgi:pilus assembly protein CpaC
MWKSLLILVVAVSMPRMLFAEDVSSVRLLVGRSTIIDVGSAIARVSLTSAEVADAVVTSANQLLVNGKMPGTISLYVWPRSGGVRRYEIVVQRDLAYLNEQMKSLFPGEAIDAQSSGKGIVLAGLVSSKDVSDKARTVAVGYVDKAEEVVNLLRMQETVASNQVLLRVRFAEVSRSAVTSLGASLFTGANGYQGVLGRTTTTTPGLSFNTTDPANPSLVFSDFLNLFLFDSKKQLGAVIQALESKGQFQSLAEPNLVAESGKEASFLAGGEFPVPIAQGSGGGNVAITVAYKEYGIRLNFTPTVIGDRVHLKVRPEVSTLDFANGITLQGFTIPALSTRRTETELELMDGQTFAIAGLMDNTVNSTLQKIPGIGDIPVLGLLFKSKAAQKNQTELVVIITPEILPRNSPGVTATLPRTPEPFLPPPPGAKSFPPPPPPFTPSRSADDAPPISPAAALAVLTKRKSTAIQIDGAPPAASTSTPAVPSLGPQDLAATDAQKALDRAHQEDDIEPVSEASEAAKADEATTKAQEAK